MVVTTNDGYILSMQWITMGLNMEYVADDGYLSFKLPRDDFLFNLRLGIKMFSLARKGRKRKEEYEGRLSLSGPLGSLDSPSTMLIDLLLLLRTHPLTFSLTSCPFYVLLHILWCPSTYPFTVKY